MRAMASLRFSPAYIVKPGHNCPELLLPSFSPSPLQALPRPARSSVSLLSPEEKLVLCYLLHLHRLFVGPPPPSPPPSKHHWTKKPWRNAGNGFSSSFSSSSQRVPASPSSSFIVSGETPGGKKSSSSSFSASKSVSCTEGIGHCKHVSSLLNAEKSADVICDCFSCYSIFWRRWNESPNRDIICQILEIVEMQDIKVSGAATEKHQEAMQTVFVEEVGGKKQRKKLKEKKKGGDVTVEFNFNAQGTARNSIKVEPNCVHTENKDDMSESAEVKENSTFVSPLQSSQAASKKKVSKGRGVKSTVTPLKESDVPTALDETQLRVSEIKNDIEEVEVNISLPTQPSSIASTSTGTLMITASTDSLKHNQVAGKRKKKKKKSQITPLDCEGPLMGEEVLKESEEEREKEDGSSDNEDATPTDNILTETGFVGRVLRGSLGAVASRLWNLVSVRFGSHSIDPYYYY